MRAGAIAQALMQDMLSDCVESHLHLLASPVLNEVNIVPDSFSVQHFQGGPRVAQELRRDLHRVRVGRVR